MPPSDKYQADSAALDAFTDKFVVITPSDTDDLPQIYKAIIVGGTPGAVVVHNHLGDTVTLYGVAGLALQGCRPRRILAAGTVATPLIGLL